MRRSLVLALAFLLGPWVLCAAAGRAGAAPDGRLPGGVRPLRYVLELEILPELERFRGSVEILIELDRPVDTIWLHGQDLRVSEAVVRPRDAAPGVPARWEPAADGFAALRLQRELVPGQALVRLQYDAAFNRQLEGLYRVDVGTDSYAFTQMQAISARLAFPGFDEPQHKTPYDVTLVVRREHEAIANTRALQVELLDGGLKRVRFATTEPLPTYLLAWAVGPLDVVQSEPVPPNAVRQRPLALRGAAVRGRGRELAYALAHTAPALAELEAYFGIEYPYDKLDLIAVPDFRAGAMENVGAITFRETRLLLDEKTAPEDQRRAFASILAHELAHMWFGNLVTMSWWDDLWLNEGFATWMASRVVERLYPENRAALATLARVHSAMDRDSLLSARQIRQPIESEHDIENAFDAITYRKGGALLAMSERWLGAEAFRRGLGLYMQRHRFGNATSDDLTAALGEAAGRDVTGPFRSFLMQPGVPLVELELQCAGASSLLLRQRRFQPAGSASSAPALWQVPVCVRYEAGGVLREGCTLLSGEHGVLELEAEGCPAWVLPNADGAGYYRWSLPPGELAALLEKGWPQLGEPERLSVADSIAAAFDSARMPAADVFAALQRFAAEPSVAVASAPMGLLRAAREELADEATRPRVEAFVRRLYGPVARRLGWEPCAGCPEDGETKLLRARVLEFLIETGRDEALRAEAAERGRRLAGLGAGGAMNPEAVASELAAIALAAAVEEGGAEVFDALLQRLQQTEDALLRSNLLEGLGAARPPELAGRALALTLDGRLRVNEQLVPLAEQMARPETREAAWQWLQQSFDAVQERVGPRMAVRTIHLAGRFCDEARARAVEAFFGPRVQQISGGPRALANTLESIRLCAARAAAQRDSARAFFQSQAP
jgi:cytosol alanyl aminopeptidase